MVVIGIIAVLATMMIASLRSANEKARVAKAKEEFRQIETAAEFLEMDTGTYVGATRRDFSKALWNQDMYGPSLSVCGSNSALSGLCDRPTAGVASCALGAPPDNQAYCEWTQEEVNKWKGPYMPTNTKDSWGTAYIFDLICRRPLYLACSNIDQLLGLYSDVNVRGPCIRSPHGTPTYYCDDLVYPILPDQ